MENAFSIHITSQVSRNSKDEFLARSDTDRMIVFPCCEIPTTLSVADSNLRSHVRRPEIGDFVAVRVTGGTHATLTGQPIAVTDLLDFELYSRTQGRTFGMPMFYYSKDPA